MPIETKVPQLPLEIVAMILEQLEFVKVKGMKPLLQTMVVCRAWRELSEEGLWRSITEPLGSSQLDEIKGKMILAGDQRRHTRFLSYDHIRYNDWSDIAGDTLDKHIKAFVGLTELGLHSVFLEGELSMVELSGLRHLTLSGGPYISSNNYDFSFAANLTSLHLGCEDDMYCNAANTGLLSLPQLVHLEVRLPDNAEDFGPNPNWDDRDELLDAIVENASRFKSFTLTGYLADWERSELFTALTSLISYTSHLHNAPTAKEMTYLSKLKHWTFLISRGSDGKRLIQDNQYHKGKLTLHFVKSILAILQRTTSKSLESVRLIANREHPWYTTSAPSQGNTWSCSTPPCFEEVREYCQEAGYTLYLLGEEE